MDILTIKEASLMWGISIRRVTVLCDEGRIDGGKESIKNLKRIDSGKVSYTDVIEELKHKYMQEV